MRRQHMNTLSARQFEILERRRMLSTQGVDDSLDEYVETFNDIASLTSSGHSNAPRLARFATVWTVAENSSATPTSVDGDGSAVMVRSFKESSEDGQAFFPYESGTGDQSHGLVEKINDQRAAIAWKSSGGSGDASGGSTVYVRLYDETLGMSAAPIRVSEATDGEATPLAIVVKQNDSTDFAVVYRLQRPGSGDDVESSEIMLRPFVNGQPAGASVHIGGSAHDDFDVDSEQFIHHGRHFVGWRTQPNGATPSPDGAGSGVFVQAMEFDGTSPVVTTPYADINASGSGDQSNLILKLSPDGSIIAGWKSVGATGSDNEDGLYLRRLNDEGALTDDIVRLNETPSADLTLHGIAATDSGVAAIYSKTRTNGVTTTDSYIRFFDRNLTARTGEILLADSLADRAHVLPVTWAASDDYLAVAWQVSELDSTPSNVGDGNGDSVYFSVYNMSEDSSGRLAGPIRPYDDIDSGTGHQRDIQINSISGNALAVTWSSLGGPNDEASASNVTNGGDVYTRLFNTNGQPRSDSEKINNERSPADDQILHTQVSSHHDTYITRSDVYYAVIMEDLNRNHDSTNDLSIAIRSGVSPAAPYFEPADFRATVQVDESGGGNIDLSSVRIQEMNSDPVRVDINLFMGDNLILQDGSDLGVTTSRKTVRQNVRLSLTGSPAALNSYFRDPTRARYEHASDETPPTRSSFSLKVVGVDGVTEPREQSRMMRVRIVEANQAPTATGLPGSLPAIPGQANSLDLSPVELADADGDTLTVLLAASSGELNAANQSGVVVTEVSDTLVSLQGSAGALNTYLDDADNLQFTPASGSSTSAMYTMIVDDGQNHVMAGSGTLGDGNGSSNGGGTNTPRIDLQLESEVAAEIVKRDRPVSWQLTVTNRPSAGVNTAATGVRVRANLPEGVTVANFLATQGTFRGSDWVLDEPLPVGETATLFLVGHVSPELESGATLQYSAFVSAADQTDVDSTVNGLSLDEDDAVRAELISVPEPELPATFSNPSPVRPRVKVTGDTVHAVATTGDDVVELRLGTDVHTLDISGHQFEFNANVVTKLFIGASEGDDFIRIVGSELNDAGHVLGERAVLNSAGYHVRTFSFEQTQLIGGEGKDYLQLFGSQEVDRLTATAEMTTMKTPTNLLMADAERVDNFGRGGADTAAFYGTPDRDRFTALPNVDHYRTAGKLQTAKGFHTVDVHGGGGQDVADLSDTPLDDEFSANPEVAQMAAAARIRRAHHFDQVIATSTQGGNDEAFFTGEKGVRDFLESGADSTTLRGDGYGSRTASGFQRNVATSDDDLDVARFLDMRNVDTLFGQAGTARATRDGRERSALGFSDIELGLAVPGQDPIFDLNSPDFDLSTLLP